MSAVASVTATPVLPAAGGPAPVSASSAGAAGSARPPAAYDPAAVSAAAAAIRESPSSIGLGFVEGRLSLVALPQPAASTPGTSSTPAPAEAGQPTEAQIEATLSDVLFQLDDLPQQQPNSPVVALLEDEQNQLEQALGQAQIGDGPALRTLSGVVLNATV